jgi:hypothetical protein
VAPRTETELYATQIGELWGTLTRTLSRLERLAAHPERLEGAVMPQVLGRLQYGLHTAGERVYGLAPAPGSEQAHAELWSSLAHARDVTASIAEALEEERREAVGLLIHEWRGALFRVRLARLRLATPPPTPEPEVDVAPREVWPQLAALLLVVLGACVFAVGATTGHWPIWAAGMLAVCSSMVVYRP